MDVWGGLSLLLNTIPVVRMVWQRVVERKMEIKIRPVGLIPFRVAKGALAFVNAGFDLSLRNHRKNEAERVIKGVVVLRCRHWLLFHKDLCQEIAIPQLNDLVISPLSQEIRLQLHDIKGTGTETLPKMSELILRLYLAGSMNKVERRLVRVRSMPVKRLPPNTIDAEG